ncbi:AAA family ATPase [Aeromonas caviae]|uniref:AAA family ATPase n=1 Tax=Aeromonas caviae TaxID=648 RepID=UPI0038730EE8
MVDLPSMYRLLRCVPNSAHVIMLGDIGQLPPVDFGLVFHELGKVRISHMAREHLMVTH